MGQLQLLVTTLPPRSTASNINDYLERIVPFRGVRVADVVLVTKTTNCEVAMESPLLLIGPVSEGGLLRQLLGVSRDSAECSISRPYSSSSDGLLGDYGLDSDDIDDIIDHLPYGSLNMFLLVEELWSAELRQFFRTSGCITLASGVISQSAMERDCNPGSDVL
jgi:uncharacterized membrane protein